MTTDSSEKPDAPEWTTEHWLDSGYGVGFIAFDVAITVVILVILIRWSPDPDSILDTLLSVFGSIDGGGVSDPGFDVTRANALLFTLLGALGYVFTPLYKDIDRSVGEVLEYNFRLVGAIPLGFGVFLLSDYLLQDTGIGVLALSFLAGLYVNTFYSRIGAIADYVLPSGPTDDTDEGTEPTDDTDEGTEPTDVTDEGAEPTDGTDEGADEGAEPTDGTDEGTEPTDDTDEDTDEGAGETTDPDR